MHDLQDEYSSRYFGQANQSIGLNEFVPQKKGKEMKRKLEYKKKNGQLSYKLKRAEVYYL